MKYDYEQKSEHLFSVTAFRFKEGYDDVFIHCKLTSCREEDTGSRCARGCEGGRRRRSLNEDDISANLYIGPVKLTNKDAGKLEEKHGVSFCFCLHSVHLGVFRETQSDFLRAMVLTDIIHRYFCAVYDYAGSEDLMRIGDNYAFCRD